MPEPEKQVDVFVVGGGINGAGIARDAAGRGFSVMLAEMGDLASGTSSAATKLIHGGLRYLEHYAFRLVHESLAEREVLWAMAPHVIRPLRFVLPHHRGLRPAVVLRAGLALYDHMGGRRLLPPTRTLDLATDPAGAPLRPGFATGFEYSDCWVDDARLVVLNARDAAGRGADIRTGTRLQRARREAGLWHLDLVTRAGRRETVAAKTLVNAAGPWVEAVLRGPLARTATRKVRLVKGSHIVVRRLYDDPRCYIFQNADGRVVFAIPYETDFTLIGTTDEDYTGDPADAAISPAETDYLLAAAAEYFAAPPGRADIVWSYAGVRPLLDDGSAAAKDATRDYLIDAEHGPAEPLLVNVFGGKLTTYRRLAEAVLAHVESALGPRGGRWTAGSTLPGGEFGPLAFDAELRRLRKDYPGFAPATARRLLRLYGTRARAVLGEAQSPAALGEHFGADLYAREVDHLIEDEWARSAADILWRRTKLGLRIEKDAAARLEGYVSQRLAALGLD